MNMIYAAAAIWYLMGFAILVHYWLKHFDTIDLGDLFAFLICSIIGPFNILNYLMDFILKTKTSTIVWRRKIT